MPSDYRQLCFTALFGIPVLLVGCPPETGDDDDDSVEQAQSCIDYLNCVTTVTPESLGLLLDAYGSSGTCWDSEDDAALCDHACEEALAALQDLYPTEADCHDWDDSECGSCLLGETSTWLWVLNPSDCNWNVPADTISTEITATPNPVFTAYFEFVLDSDVVLTGTLPCTLTGDGDFLCDDEADPGIWMDIYGTFESSGLTGTLYIYSVEDETEYVCGYTGTPI